jgi:hypothetical protein
MCEAYMIRTMLSLAKGVELGQLSMSFPAIKCMRSIQFLDEDGWHGRGGQLWEEKDSRDGKLRRCIYTAGALMSCAENFGVDLKALAASC